jgi:uncharacterized protein involved in type VI secretion and phage assembly
MTAGPFYGKYRGVVTVNVDPQRLGRIKAQVPDVFGDRDSAWAVACVPCGAGQIAVPEIGARVWIEFERGDLDYPIWTGCWWSDAADAFPPRVVVAKAGGHTILLDDTPGGGGITLQSATGASVAITGGGVVIDNGAGARITLTGPQVSINNGALDIT